MSTSAPLSVRKEEIAQPFRSARFRLMSCKELPAVMTLYLLTSMVSLAFWTWLAGRIGKNRTFELCILWTVVVLGAFPLLGPGG